MITSGSLRTMLAGSLLCLSGCADLRLNRNTDDLSTTVESLYTQQALNNLSKSIDDEFAIPSQIDVTAGTVQTVDTVTPSLTIPFTPQIVNSIAGATPSHSNTLAGFGGTLGASVTQQQNWNVAPVVDANALRNLRALYRHALFPTNLKSEFHPYEIVVGGRFFLDPYHLRQPRCVLCYSGKEMLISDVGPTQPNKKLPGAWVFWTGGGRGGVHPHPPPEGTSVVNLGHYGDHDLFVSKADYAAGVVDDFVLFIMPSGQLPETFPIPAEEGKGGGGKPVPAAGADVATPPKTTVDGRPPPPGNRTLQYYFPAGGGYQLMPRGGGTTFSTPLPGIQVNPTQ